MILLENSLYGVRQNDFVRETSISPFRGPLEGVALKIKTFLGPERATSEGSVI
jgi:hypothetical protein